MIFLRESPLNYIAVPWITLLALREKHGQSPIQSQAIRLLHFSNNSWKRGMFQKLNLTYMHHQQIVTVLIIWRKKWFLFLQHLKWNTRSLLWNLKRRVFQFPRDNTVAATVPLQPSCWHEDLDSRHPSLSAEWRWEHSQMEVGECSACWLGRACLPARMPSILGSRSQLCQQPGRAPRNAGSRGSDWV